MRLGTLWQGHRRRRQILVVTLVAVLAAAFIPACAGTQDDGNTWVGTWATSPVVLPPPRDGAPQGLGPAARIQDQTVRQIVHTSIGGSAVRVAVTNLFGSQPLEIGAAHVALRVDGASIDAETARPLQFGGQPTVTIAAGSMVVSDAVELSVPLGVEIGTGFSLHAIALCVALAPCLGEYIICL